MWPSRSERQCRCQAIAAPVGTRALADDHPGALPT